MTKQYQKMVFRSKEKRHHIKLIKDKFFGNDKGYGYFGKDKKRYNFVLEDGGNNLYEPIRSEALKYFKENDIEWWGDNPDYPTGHTVSSQIACLNHLMFLRQKPTEVLSLINGLGRIEFTKVLPVPCDADISYIAFEVISDHSYLNEPEHIRGSYCTSIDALIYAEDINNKKWIIPIEWKYTEAYGDSSEDDKSLEDYKWRKGEHGKGKERMRRYNGLITKSRQLKSLENYESSAYYFEPFYQLMRQTLWAEQMIKNKATERIKADRYLHIHVIPKNNVDLLQKTYKVSNQMMETTWRSMLNEQSKYIIIDPQELMSPIKGRCPELYNYLKMRYYDK